MASKKDKEMQALMEAMEQRMTEAIKEMGKQMKDFFVKEVAELEKRVGEKLEKEVGELKKELQNLSQKSGEVEKKVQEIDQRMESIAKENKRLDIMADCRAMQTHIRLRGIQEDLNEDIREIAKKLSFQRGREGEAKGRVCEKHQEPLKLFCTEDEAPLCVVCDRSKEHRDHRVIPMEEAAREYQDKFCCCLGLLRKEREEILAHQVDLVGKSQDLLSQTEVKRQKMVAEFRKMHTFLEEQEKRLLAQVEEVKKVIAEERDEQLSRLSKEISSLGSLIREVEEKIEQPMAEFLQDARSSLQRYEKKEKFRNPVTFTSEWRIWELCARDYSLEVNMKLFRDTLPSQLQVQKAAHVILDPSTANPCLLLSEDQKTVRWGSKAQELPKNPERFDNYTVVLGCEGFMEGCHFWELSVGSKDGWSVGVAKKSVNRKGPLTFGPEGGIWALGYYGNGYYGLTRPPCPLPFLSGELKRIRVCLNCPEGRVAFFDGDRDTLLYEFSGASFQGETLLPFFQVFRNGHISLPLYANKGFD